MALHQRSKFQEYYKAQEIVGDDEYDDWLACLDTPLNLTFRVSSAGKSMASIINKLEQVFRPNLKQQADVDLRPVPWLTTIHCWEINRTTSEMRKLAKEHDWVSRFMKFIITHTSTGCISRQEIVSMVPPMLLKVESNHHVLDMCASPGSKTAQLLENMATDTAENNLPTGVVVANDMSRSRASMLVHQCNRMGSPSLVVTCHNASEFPQVESYDRILCDVPCSGDGTLRKSPQAWKKWHSGNGLSLHPVQCSIARRGIELLKIGGLLVYSTCALNPIENEAVVSEILRSFGPSLEIVNPGQKDLDFISKPGLTKWKVGWEKKKSHGKKPSHETQITWFNSFEETPDQIAGSRIVKSMFPPKEPWILNQLKNCFRFVPGCPGNTGGFFIAVFRKLSHSIPRPIEQSEMPVVERRIPPEDYVCARCNQKGHYIHHCELRKNKPAADKEVKAEPLFLPVENELLASIKDFYGLVDEFPSANLVAKSDKACSIYYVTESARAFCTSGLFHVISTGLRAFVKDKSKNAQHRITQKSLQYILPYIRHRVVQVLPGDYKTVLDIDGSESYSVFSAETAEKFKREEPGPAVIVPERLVELAIVVHLGIENLSVNVSSEYLPMLSALFEEKTS